MDSQQELLPELLLLLREFLDASTQVSYCLTSNFFWEQRKRTVRLKMFATLCASDGNLRLLCWAREQGYSWDSRTCAAASGNGHLETLKWSREQGCPWDSETCSAAARIGQIETLKWLREQGCPWDSYACYAAAKNGHLELSSG
jgi:hypothetical protein